jgi:hypothetical protein
VEAQTLLQASTMVLGQIQAHWLPLVSPASFEEVEWSSVDSNPSLLALGASQQVSAPSAWSSTMDLGQNSPHWCAPISFANFAEEL